NALPQRLRLADVQDLPVRVPKEVDARLREQPLQLVLDVVRRHMTQRIRAVLRLGAASLAALLLAGCGGPKPHPIAVGAAEDAPKGSDPGAAMTLAQRAGFGAITLSAVWTPPATAPDPALLDQLRGAVRAAVAANIRPVVAVFSFSGVTPL